MKAKVTLIYKVEAIIEADNEDMIYDYANETTPSEFYEDCAKHGTYADEIYDEEIEFIPDWADTKVNLIFTDN